MPNNESQNSQFSSPYGYQKIEKILNFKPKRSIEDAIKDLIIAFEKKKFVDPLNNSLYYNIATMKKVNLE